MSAAAPPAASNSPVPPSSRPEVCGPHAPERPYPIYLRGEVEKGFGRGSKDLGCPTANLPARVVGPGSKLTRTGVYFGFARVLPQEEDDDFLTDSEDADGPSSSSGNGTGATSVDDDDDDDDNEVVLGASPIQDGADGFPQSGRTKARQDSKSSLQQQANLLRPSDGRSTDKEAVVSAMELKAAASAASASASAAAASGAAAEPIPTPQESHSSRHASSGSGTGSAFSSLSRRHKKRRIPLRQEDSRVFPMVMSVGWNPFYKNTYKTAEVHILHEFGADFYGLEIRVVVLGYVRPEYNYDSMDALIADIEMDKKVTVNSLNRPLYQDYARDPFLGKVAS